MNHPTFIRVQDELVNLSQCQRAYVENTTLVFEHGEEEIEIEYRTDGEAKKAFEAVQQLLTSKGLFLGGVN